MHIHVNDPAEVFRIAARFGTVSGEKADDMQRQQHAAHVVGRKVAVVTDSGADIPEDEMDRLDIHMVPLRVHFGDKQLPRPVGITSEEFYDELVRNPHHPKTSQPPPGDFRRQFEFLASHYPARRLGQPDAQGERHLCRGRDGGGAHRRARQGHGARLRATHRSARGSSRCMPRSARQAGYDAERVLAATRAILPRTRTFGADRIARVLPCAAVACPAGSRTSRTRLR